MTRNDIRQCTDIEALRAECIRLRQGLWDCFAATGADTDGDATPDALVSDICAVTLREVSELAAELREACDRLYPT